MTGVVYALIDPRTNVIRYVGFSVKSPWRRLRGHINCAKSLRNTGRKLNNRARDSWLLELVDAGLAPVCVELLKGVPVDEAPAWEYKAMDVAERHGAVLTNHHRGGLHAKRCSHQLIEVDINSAWA